MNFESKLKLILYVQACQGDLAVGLYLWAHHILPILGGKSGSNPQSRDLVLQLVERFELFASLSNTHNTHPLCVLHLFH